MASCTGYEQNLNINTYIYYELIDCYLKIDSSEIKSDIAISQDLSAYKYFEPLYLSDGQRVPPPGPRNFINETRFDNINLKQSDIDFIIDQIKRSQKLTGQFNSKIDSLSDKDGDTNKFYYFYLPLFTADSSFVYLQYGYFDNGYEKGQAVFLKTDLSKSQCQIIDKYLLWMN